MVTRGVPSPALVAFLAQGDIDLYLGRAVDAWERISEHWPILTQRFADARPEHADTLPLPAGAQRVGHGGPPSGRGAFVAATERDARRLKRERRAWADAFSA